MSEINEIVETSNNRNLVQTNIKEIAKLAKKDVDIRSAVTDNTIDNMKAFLLVYSRSQLTRVVKLTDALGKLEDELITKSLQPENADPEMLMAVIRTIQNSLNSAMNLIKQVTSDESFINVMISQTNTINNTFNQYNNNQKLMLPNQDSRDKVRNIVAQLIEKVDSLKDDDNIIDEVVEDEEEE